MTTLRAFTGLILLTFWTSASFGADRAREIVKQVDELYRAKSSRARIEMKIVTPDWRRTLVMEAWSEGMKKTFIRIEEPAKERGVATLRLGTEMWNYLPRTNKVIKIPPSMMMSSWMGSDFTNDDLVREFTLLDDYTFEEVEPEGSDSSLIYIRCIPKPDVPVVWSSILMAVTRNYLPAWQKYYDDREKLIRTLTYSDVKVFDGRRLPSRLVMAPESKQGHQTEIHYLELELNIKLDDSVFSLRNLRSTR